jgi:site-specific DNA-adenine methylase
MSIYQGGKKRIGKRIYKVISSIERELNKTEYNLDYFEPFCGMCGVLRHFAKTDDRNVFACDANEDLVLLLRAIQKGWNPPTTCSESQWEKFKNSKEHSAKRGFIGIAASWGGIFFQGYRLGYTNERNYLKEASNGLEKLTPDIKNVRFMESRSYEKFKPKGFLIYCDPPYKGNQLGKERGLFRNFDHEKFWDKMRQWSKDNIVIISESTAPRDFKKVWSTQSHVNNSDRYETKKYLDNLYVCENIYAQIPSWLRKEIKCI